jgi:DNA-binding CsgD family transcriptional regulator
VFAAENLKNVFGWNIVFSRESVGLATLRVWPLLVFFRGAVDLQPVFGENQSLFHGVSLLVLCVSLFCFALPWWGEKSQSKTATALFVTLAVVWPLSVVLATQVEALSLPMALFAGVSTGLISSFLMYVWGLCYARLLPEESYGANVASYFLSAFLFSFTLGLPSEYFLLVCFVFPFLSYFLLRRSLSQGMSVDIVATDAEVSEIPDTSEIESNRRFGSLKLLLGVLLLGFAAGLMYGLLNVFERPLEIFSFHNFAATTIVVVLLMVPVVLRRQFEFSFTYRVGMLLIAVSVLFVQLQSVAELVLRVGYIFFSCTLWEVLVLRQRESSHGRYSIYALGIGCMYLGIFLGQMLCVLLQNYFVNNLIVPISIIEVIVLLAFFLRLGDVEEKSSLVSNLEKAQPEEVNFFDEAAQQAGLTKRQIEVFDLLVQGYSSKMIQEKLFLSSSTVNSHINAIYRKFNVHSKDELMKELGK